MDGKRGMVRKRKGKRGRVGKEGEAGPHVVVSICNPRTWERYRRNTSSRAATDIQKKSEDFTGNIETLERYVTGSIVITSCCSDKNTMTRSCQELACHPVSQGWQPNRGMESEIGAKSC